MFVLSLPEVLVSCILGDLSNPWTWLASSDWPTFVLVTVDAVAQQTLDNYVLIKMFDLISTANAFASSRRPSSALLRF